MRGMILILYLEETSSLVRLHGIMLAVALLVILVAIWCLWRIWRFNRELMEQNQSMLERIEAEMPEVAQAIEVSQPSQDATPGRMLYARLYELMKNPEVYTDPEANHESLARLLGTNHTYVYAALRECAGTTPADFINQYRLRHAARLLTDTDDPVALIIEMSGIPSRSTFNRLFREQYAMSPTEYRRAVKTADF